MIFYMQTGCNKVKLELGSGPGSSTFGLIEFFKYLAYDNHLTEFILELTLVEREHEFIAI